MTPEPTQRLALILGLATGILLLLVCLTVQVLSQQPLVSASRIIWGVIGVGGLVIMVFNARLLRRHGRPPRKD